MKFFKKLLKIIIGLLVLFLVGVWLFSKTGTSESSTVCAEFPDCTLSIFQASADVNHLPFHSLDERLNARKIAQHLSTNHHEYEFTSNDALSIIPQLGSRAPPSLAPVFQMYIVVSTPTLSAPL